MVEQRERKKFAQNKVQWLFSREYMNEEEIGRQKKKLFDKKRFHTVRAFWMILLFFENGLDIVSMYTCGRLIYDSSFNGFAYLDWNGSHNKILVVLNGKMGWQNWQSSEIEIDAYLFVLNLKI